MVQRLKAATQQDREKVKSEIEKELNAEYAAYLKSRQKPILELKAQLDKLQAEFDAKLAAYKEQEALQKVLVQHRLDTIWLTARGLSWPVEKKKREIPTVKAKANGQSTTPVGKPASQPQRTNRSSIKTGKKTIPTSRTFEVYLPGMV